MSRSTILASLSAALVIGVACAPKSSAPATPAPSAPAATAPAPAPAPPAPAPRPAAAAPAPTPAPAPAAPAAPAPAGPEAGGRGGRGTPPPPPPAPPAVMPAPKAPIVSAVRPSPDPRVGLRAGWWDADEALWNMRRMSTTPPHEKNLGVTNSDLAFSRNLVVQGNYNGFAIYDISNPSAPRVVQTYFCPASQNDVSVYDNLLFMSSEAGNSRADCGFGGVPEPVSRERVRGVRIFDISNLSAPRLVKNVQTCRGSHTHTVVTQPGDKENIYIYVSGSAGVRSAEEMSGCLQAPQEDPNSSLFRIEVIRVPLAAPQNAEIVHGARIFQGLAPAPRNPDRDAAGARAAGPGGAGAPPAAGRGAPPAGAGAAAPPPGGVVAGGGGAPGAPGAPGAGRGGRGGAPTGPNQCHDITVYPDVGLAGGACGGYGLLLDIREAANPVRIDFAGDANMAFWHSATFSNDGSKVLFSDEWGGGSAPRCRATDRLEWGADALFAIENGKMVFKSYFKMPAAQTDFENCVAHNGSLIPIPGRDVMVQGWYQGGIDVFDWTDPARPIEIAYHDRGPLDGSRLRSAGSWSVYWYNGLIISSEISRGLDIFELVPSPHISQNEIDAAKSVVFNYFNTQEQRKFAWPPTFALARAYVDQLERSTGLSAARLSAVRAALQSAEGATGAARRTALANLATSLNADLAGSRDQAKLRMLIGAVGDLAK